jgi:hypothetical protein
MSRETDSRGNIVTGVNEILSEIESDSEDIGSKIVAIDKLYKTAADLYRSEKSRYAKEAIRNAVDREKKRLLQNAKFSIGAIETAIWAIAAIGCGVSMYIVMVDGRVVECNINNFPVQLRMTYRTIASNGSSCGVPQEDIADAKAVVSCVTSVLIPLLLLGVCGAIIRIWATDDKKPRWIFRLFVFVLIACIASLLYQAISANRHMLAVRIASVLTLSTIMVLIIVHMDMHCKSPKNWCRDEAIKDASGVATSAVQITIGTGKALRRVVTGAIKKASSLTLPRRRRVAPEHVSEQKQEGYKMHSNPLFKGRSAPAPALAPELAPATSAPVATASISPATSAPVATASISPATSAPVATASISPATSAPVQIIAAIPPTSIVTDKAPWGLRNVGNTCFINALVQCLFHVHPGIIANTRTQLASEIIAELQKIKGGKLADTNDLAALIWGKKFTKDSQSDAHELLAHLRDIGVIDTSKFEIVIQTTKKCSSGHESVTDEKAFEYFVSPDTCSYIGDKSETITDYTCSKCRVKTNARSTTSIVSASDVFMCLVRRYGLGVSKNTDPCLLTDATICGNKYRLVGIVRHNGTDQKSGHYVACESDPILSNFFHSLTWSRLSQKCPHRRTVVQMR